MLNILNKSMSEWMKPEQLSLGWCGQLWVISLHFVLGTGCVVRTVTKMWTTGERGELSAPWLLHFECVFLYTSFGPILTLPVLPDCFIVALPVPSVSCRIWLSPGASTICHHVLSTLLYPISLSLWGWPRVYCGCSAIGSCQNQNSLIKNDNASKYITLLLQSPLWTLSY